MVRWMAFLAASTALAGCTAPPPRRSRRAGRAGGGRSAGAGAAAEARHIGTLRLRHRRHGHRPSLPGDNFYQYANGNWDRNTPIPADKSNYGMFTVLDDLSQERTRGIIEEAAKDPASKIGDAYASFMDEAAVEAKGLAPLKPWLDRDQGPAEQAPDYAALCAKADRIGISAPFAGFVGQDDKQSRPLCHRPDPGRPRPARPRLLSVDDAKIVENRGQISRPSRPSADPGRRAQRRGARPRRSSLSSAGSPRSTGPRSRAATRPRPTTDDARRAREAARRASTSAAYLDGHRASMPARDQSSLQPSAFTGIAALVAKTPLPVLKDQLLVRSLDHYAAVLPQRLRRRQFRLLRHRPVNGTPRAGGALEARRSNFITGALADDVSKIYVERYFPPEAKARGRRAGQERHRGDGPPARRA